MYAHTLKQIKLCTWGHCQLGFALQDDLAVVVYGRQHALLEEDHVVFAQPKVALAQKELFSRLHGPAACHDVPRQKFRYDLFCDSFIHWSLCAGAM